MVFLMIGNSIMYYFISVTCFRKVCAHCLHTREQHDIKDNENIRGVSVGKILFAPDAVGNSSPSNSPAMPRGRYGTRISVI